MGGGRAGTARAVVVQRNVGVLRSAVKAMV